MKRRSDTSTLLGPGYVVPSPNCRRISTSMTMIHLCDCIIDMDARIAHRGNLEVPLTDKEAALLQYLAARPGLVVGRDELLKAVWGITEAVITRTVDTTMRRLRKKVELAPATPQHLLTVHGAGYRFVTSATRPATVATPPAHTNIDPVSTSFVGRARAQTQLDNWLASDAPLITVVGPGGMGKTRLACHWALRVGGQFVGGAFIAPLAGCATDLEAFDIVARALGRTAHDPASLSQALGTVLPTLVILDNLEQLPDSGQHLVATLLAAAPQIRWLITSRHHLSLPDEQLLSLQPLNPDEAKSLVKSRAPSVPGGLPTPADAWAQIAQRAGGLPLAVELVASWVPLLGVDGALAQLDRHGLMLPGRALPTDARHASVQAAVLGSFDLVDTERLSRIFSLAAFRAQFDVNDAAQVLGMGPIEALRELDALVARSLVQPVGRGRFRIFVPVRELATVPSQARKEHARWTLAKALEMAHPPFDLDGLRQLVPDSTAAHEWMLANGQANQAAELVVALDWMLSRVGPRALHASLLDHSLAATPSRAFQGQLLRCQATLARANGHLAEAQSLAESALLATTQAGTIEDLGLVRLAQALIAHSAAQWTSARAFYMQANSALSAGSPTPAQVRTLSEMSSVLSHLGEHEESMARAEAALLLAQQIQDPSTHAQATRVLARLLYLDGRSGRATRLLSHGVKQCAEARDHRGELASRWQYGLCLLALNEPKEAEAVLERAMELLQRHPLAIMDGLVLSALGAAQWLAGDEPLGRASLEKATLLYEQANSRHRAAWPLSWLAVLHAHRNNAVRARNAIDEARGLARAGYRLQVDAAEIAVFTVEKRHDLARAREQAVRADPTFSQDPDARLTIRVLTRRL